MHTAGGLYDATNGRRYVALTNRAQADPNNSDSGALLLAPRLRQIYSGCFSARRNTIRR